MPVSRMRMRPWLEQMIESREVPGLHWVDKDHKMFSVPWKHAARHGWEMDKDASLFKLWAKHTGKYADGQPCDPKTWKANFRCAMNSLPDIEEVKDKSVNKGHQAVRVFRMLPVAPKCRDRRSRISKRRSTKVKYEEESSDSDSVSPASPLQSHPLSTRDIRVPESNAHTDTQEPIFINHPEVPDWSSMVEIGFDNYQRRFEVSPTRSSCPGDDEIIEICAQWERERSGLSLYSNGFLSDGQQCTSPSSQSSEASSDDFDELPQYTTLSSSLSSSDGLITNLYPFTSTLY